ncbi:TPA: hypothetical protein JBL19_06195 [Legionella pneumophila]|nr:hypothetical protein [Legionella pneumophila subsp. fraseri]HAT1796293.1 hypothetical protein [Legionella pneumophila]MDW8961436.1 hypothetical protein [Legionella pneumophila subsp. fraseri]MDW9036288.1 hypothetical protein [Legionella pneumophila subsp. fraseri]MDW9038955.1 hypothetical protein [Legionella pneumophila subsp. fraseri]
MNDFTKEELMALSIYTLSIVGESDLQRKIQSMIDNYQKPKCDHEFKLSRSFYGTDENCYRCTKCLIKVENVLNE